VFDVGGVGDVFGVKEVVDHVLNNGSGFFIDLADDLGAFFDGLGDGFDKGVVVGLET
jgi:hypothetical protein